MYILGKSIPILERSALPLAIHYIGNMRCFEFKLYDQPLSEEEAQRHKVWFVSEVVKAVNELHDRAKVAHLDIRLENICVDDESNRLILVDLDRSRPIFVIAEDVHVLYGNHEMYWGPAGSHNWPVSMLDWRQVGLMFKTRVLINHEFVTKLIEEGMFYTVLCCYVVLLYALFIHKLLPLKSAINF